MIKKFYEHNNININDRIICNDFINVLDPYFIRMSIKLNNETGRVFHIKYDLLYVVFDNYFSYLQHDSEKIKFNRCLILNQSNVQKYDTKGGNFLKVTNKFRSVIENCEYIDFPANIDIDYIDITEHNDLISYIPKNRLNRLNNESDAWFSNFRQNMSIGRFLKLLNPYTNNISLNKKIDIYKASYDSLISLKSKFQIIEGEDIYYWYNEKNYADGNGKLKKSCMRTKIDRLKFYVENKHKVSLLALINERGQLEGRSLIWKVDSPDIVYMDRVYTIHQSDEQRFINLAKENGWKTYYDENLGKLIVNDIYNKSPYPEANPYMDTFQFYYIRGKHGNSYISNVEEYQEPDSIYYIYDYND